MLRFVQIVITDIALEISMRRKTETDAVMLLPKAPTSNVQFIMDVLYKGEMTHTLVCT